MAARSPELARLFELTHSVAVNGMTGSEWIVEAFGCDAERLTRVSALQQLFDAIVRERGLHPVGSAHWHQFPAPGGITGLWLLAESHLTIHTFPEHTSACINLFCCTPRDAWDWNARLSALLGADQVEVRMVERAYGAVRPASPSVHA